MFNTKLVSVRIDEDVVNAIDEWCKVSGYYSRSAVIGHILRKGVVSALLNNGRVTNTFRNLTLLKFKSEWED